MSPPLLLTLAAVAALVLWWFLRRHFRRLLLPGREDYTEEERAGLPDSLVRLDLPSSQGVQRAWYLPPPGGGPPQATWLLLGGREGRALRWFHHLGESHLPGVALLALEYPGYGGSPGRATPEIALRCADEALRALKDHLGGPHWGRLGVAGYSIGAALALQFARHHPVERVLLLAPFSRLRDVLVRRYGPAILLLSPIGLDNAKAITHLARRPAPPEILILHDPDDPFIPWPMAETLAAQAGSAARLDPVPGAGHDHLVRDGKDVIVEYLCS